MRKISFSLTAALVILGIAVSTGCRRQTNDEEAAIMEPKPKRVAVMITEGFQDAETLEPIKYLNERGIETVVIGPDAVEVKAYNSEQTVVIDKAVADVRVDEFDALIIPGGRSPARLREHAGAVAFAREFVESGKPVAAICQALASS